MPPKKIAKKLPEGDRTTSSDYFRLSSQPNPEEQQSLRSWLIEAAKGVNPIDTNIRIKEVGEGQDHWVLWIPRKAAPQLWILNRGTDKDECREKSLLALAQHPAPMKKESRAFKHLANNAWTRANITTCIASFAQSGTYWKEDRCIIGLQRPTTIQTKVLNTMVKVVRDTKLYAQETRPLTHNLELLTTVWKWSNGAKFCPSPVIERFAEAWISHIIQASQSVKLRLDAAQETRSKINCTWPLFRNAERNPVWCDIHGNKF